MTKRWVARDTMKGTETEAQHRTHDCKIARKTSDHLIIENRNVRYLSPKSETRNDNCGHALFYNPPYSSKKTFLYLQISLVSLKTDFSVPISPKSDLFRYVPCTGSVSSLLWTFPFVPSRPSDLMSRTTITIFRRSSIVPEFGNFPSKNFFFDIDFFQFIKKIKSFKLV